MEWTSHFSLAQLPREARGTRSHYADERATGIAHANVPGVENGTRFPSKGTLRARWAFDGMAFDEVTVADARDKLKRIDGAG